VPTVQRQCRTTARHPAKQGPYRIHQIEYIAKNLTLLHNARFVHLKANNQSVNNGLFPATPTNVAIFYARDEALAGAHAQLVGLDMHVHAFLFLSTQFYYEG